MSSTTRLAPGSCCGCSATPISVTFCYADCQTGVGITGVTFEVLSGSTSLGTCTTAGSGGCCTISVAPGAGTYTVKVTDGSNVFTLLTSLSAGTFNYSRNFVEVHGCGNLAAQGVPVSITPGTGRTLSPTSFTTDSAGRAHFPYDSGGSFGYATTSPRFNNTSGTTTTCPVVTLTAASGYQCIASPCSCAVPLCNTLQLTDSALGTTTITSPSNGVWTGTLPYSSSTCGCPAASGTITYTFAACGTPVLTAEYSLGPTNTIPCGPGYTLGCAGYPSYGTASPGFTGAPGNSCGPPFSSILQAAGCGPCATCSAFGHTYDEGCGNNTSPWGVVSTITITILDVC